LHTSICRRKRVGIIPFWILGIFVNRNMIASLLPLVRKRLVKTRVIRSFTELHWLKIAMTGVKIN